MMVTIREHNKTWKDAEHALVCDWPADITVQWGGGGLVLGKKSYVTAFFEAFSDRPGCGFVRGEGKTIEAAERDCFDRFLKYSACKSHRWGRKNYRNGGAFCDKCGAFGSPFKEIVSLGKWREPCEYWWKDMNDWEVNPPAKNHFSRASYLRWKHFGFKKAPNFSRATSKD